MRQHVLIAGFCISIIAAGCGRQTLAPAAYVKYVEDSGNGLIQSRNAGEVIFKLQYKPADYVIAQENARASLSEHFYQERKQKLGNMLYFTLEIKSGTADILMHGMQDESEYYRRVNYYSLDFQQDIQMKIGTDTIACAMYQFENTYGVTPYVRMLLGFSGKYNEKITQTDPVVLIDDHVFGGGKMQFKFNHDQLLNVPNIKLN